MVEGDEPEAALAQLVLSKHPFDRWNVQQIAELTGVNLSALSPRRNDLLWSWGDITARTQPT